MTSQNFAERVIQVVQLIPKGRVTTYGAIAHYIGTGGSARTVGYVLGNSIEGRMDVPAHRVVNSAGLLSGRHAFSPEYPMEQRLREEGIEVENNRVLDFKNLLWHPALEL